MRRTETVHVTRRTTFDDTGTVYGSRSSYEGRPPAVDAEWYDDRQSDDRPWTVRAEPRALPQSDDRYDDRYRDERRDDRHDDRRRYDERDRGYDRRDDRRDERDRYDDRRSYDERDRGHDRRDDRYDDRDRGYEPDRRSHDRPDDRGYVDRGQDDRAYDDRGRERTVTTTVASRALVPPSGDLSLTRLLPTGQAGGDPARWAGVVRRGAWRAPAPR